MLVNVAHDHGPDAPYKDMMFVITMTLRRGVQVTVRSAALCGGFRARVLTDVHRMWYVLVWVAENRHSEAVTRPCPGRLDRCQWRELIVVAAEAADGQERETSDRRPGEHCKNAARAHRRRHVVVERRTSTTSEIERNGKSTIEQRGLYSMVVVIIKRMFGRRLLSLQSKRRFVFEFIARVNTEEITFYKQSIINYVIYVY